METVISGGPKIFDVNWGEISYKIFCNKTTPK